jgi:rare lipoprotein A
MKPWHGARKGVRALTIGIPISAAALGAGDAVAATPTQAGGAGPVPEPITIGPPWEQTSPTYTVRIHHRQTIAVLSGQRVQVRGRLLPAVAGRQVALQALENGGWQTLVTARTRATGAFVLRYVAGSAGQALIRVRIPDERLTGRSTARAGEMTVYQQAEASWYNDAGTTACGFHAYYGVANRTLPCGTAVSFRYNGRSVNATVDDRGPYVGGRDWDLNQNTASALGFGGVGVVWSSR